VPIVKGAPTRIQLNIGTKANWVSRVHLTTLLRNVILFDILVLSNTSIIL